MMHGAWSIIIEVPYCFSRSYVKFQGHMALKIVEFDPNWAFPDCNSSLNSPLAMKCCTKLETTKERCPIVFQGHPSNLKVTRYKISPILTQKWAFPDYRPVAAFKSLRFALFGKHWCTGLGSNTFYQIQIQIQKFGFFKYKYKYFVKF